jgi:hypothetical protein
MSLSTFLNGRAPSTLRGLQFLALSDAGVILTRTATSDSGGGASLAWGTAGTVACRIDPLTTDSRVTGGVIDERSTHVVTAPMGSTVSASDRLVISGRGTFEVTAAGQTTSEFAHIFEVIEIS